MSTSLQAAPSPPRPPTAPVAAGSLEAHAQGREVRLLWRQLPTDTCPHCARRSGAVTSRVHSAGRLKSPKAFAATALLSSSLVISLIPAFPLLVSFVRHNERAVPFDVRLCHECDRALRLGNRLTRLGYQVSGALPLGVFFGGGLLAVLRDTPLSLAAFALAELTALVVATLGVVFIRRQRRRCLPFVRDFDGRVWRVELPAAWRQVLTTEAAASIDSDEAEA